MDTSVHWAVWLFAGVGIGLLPILGENRILGIVQGLVVISSPVVIFMKAGSAFLPFILFYGGLMVASAVVFRRNKARAESSRRAAIDKKKKRWGA